MLDVFWQPQPTELPTLGILERVFFLIIPIVVGVLVASQPNSLRLKRAFQGLQPLQLLGLYGWYMAAHVPLSESLPLYHCRVAMFGILFLSNHLLFKRYLALLGIAGSLLAFSYPVLDPYPLFHVTNISFILGHAALLGNALCYLQDHQTSITLSARLIFLKTLFLNSIQVLANHLTGGNYGFMSDSPIVHIHQPLVNLLLVGVVLTVLILFVQKLFDVWVIKIAKMPQTFKV